MTKNYKLGGLYYKLGDDMARHLKEHSRVDDARLAMAGDLTVTATDLRHVAHGLSGKSFKITADCHFIGIESDDPATIKVLDGLVKEGLLSESEDPDLGNPDL